MLALRSDHLSRGTAITSLCRGSETLAETFKLEVKLQHAAQEQAKHIERAMPSTI